MEGRNTNLRTEPNDGMRLLTFFFVLCGAVCVSSNQVVVSDKVNAVLGNNITLGCRILLEPNLSLTQISWERHLPSGPITLAVFNPEIGTSYGLEYSKRISFVSPSIRDATIIIEGVGFADIGSYTCKVTTFPLGIMEAWTFVNVSDPPRPSVSPADPPRPSVSPIRYASGTGMDVDVDRRALFIPPTEASVHDVNLGHIIGGVMGGILSLVLLIRGATYYYSKEGRCAFKTHTNFNV